MNKTTHILLTLILILLAVNVAMTSKLLMQKPSSAVMAEKSATLSTEIAKAWGKNVVELYNREDYQGLYALFNEQAKVKISQEQLQQQLQKLHALFGNIEEYALTNSVKMGEKGGELYYQLSFNVRVKGPNVEQGTLTISMIMQDDKASLYGVRLNAVQSLD